MNSKFAKIQKNQIQKHILPIIPKNKRGFSSKVDLTQIVECIIYKLRTSVQWKCLFIEIEDVTHPSSWQLVYYYYRKWGKMDVFKTLFESCLSLQKVSIANVYGVPAYEDTSNQTSRKTFETGRTQNTAESDFLMKICTKNASSTSGLSRG
jgi:hypothetical protein